MRINHNVTSMIAQGAVRKNNNSLTKSLEKLSTGLRINSASDGPAALSISENLRTQYRGLAVAQRNAQDGIGLLQVADGGMNEISDIVQKMRELAIESSSDTLTATERGYMDTEYTSLRSEISRIANTTKYSNQNVLNGAGFGGNSSASSVLHIGANATAAYNTMTISIATMTTADSNGLNLDGSSIATRAGASSAITSIDAAITKVNGSRSQIGAYINRLDHAINSMMTVEHNTVAADSYVRDTDFAKETANYTKNSILLQSSLAMISQANMSPQSVLGLLS